MIQYKAYCREFDLPMKISPWPNRINGISSSVAVLGITSITMVITIPFPGLGIASTFKFNITRARAPSLLSLRDMKSTGMEISIQRHRLVLGKRIQPLVFENDFLYHRWTRSEMGCFEENVPFALYTIGELTKLHGSFWHPSLNALHNELRRARPDEDHPGIRSILQEITRRCRICSKTAAKPKRFKLTIGSENDRFNHVIAVYIMYIMSLPVVHIVDE